MRSASVLIKKVLACVVGLGMMGLAACGGGAGGSSTSNASSSAKGGSSSSSSSASNGKAVVVYFSASGNTKRAAEAIAEELNAPTFELTPQQPYTDEDLDWTDPDSRVIREHENESLQDGVRLGYLQHRIPWLSDLVDDARLAGERLRQVQRFHGQDDHSFLHFNQLRHR